MNIIKSLHASLLHKTFEFQKKHFFVISMLWGFRLSDGEPVLEQKLWESAAEAIERNRILDAGMPKSQAEFLALGSFFSPQGKPVKGGKASVQLGTLYKELAVQGNRYWMKTLGGAWGIKGPEPFSEMPLDYQHGFGGDGFEKNPSGKGFTPVFTELGEEHPLPNVEYPKQLIGSPNDRPDPAGFNRIGETWKQRAVLSGTYDERYLRKSIPGLPEDINWVYFNDAAEDQRFPGFLKGDELFEISNMHPEKPRLTNRLPGIRGRCFLNRAVGEELIFEEIETVLDTVIFIPRHNLGILIHRGSQLVTDDLGTDVKHVMLAHEGIHDKKRDKQFYQQELDKRTDPEEGFKYLMLTTPLIPDGCTCGFELMQNAGETVSVNALGENMENYARQKEQECTDFSRQKIAEAEQKQEELFQQLSEQGVESSAIKEEVKKLKQQAKGFTGGPEADESPHEARIRELMNAVLPGMLDDPPKPDITKLDLKKIEELQAYLIEHAETTKSEAIAKTVKKLEELKDNEDLKKLQELDDIKKQEGTDKVFKSLEDAFDMEDAISKLTNEPDVDATPPPLPRIKLHSHFEELKQRTASIQQQLKEVEELTETEIPDIREKAEQIKQGMEQTVEEMELSQLDQHIDDLAPDLIAAENLAKESYRLGAHSIESSSSPHEGSEAEIAAALLLRYKNREKTAEGDYAFIDLSNQQLNGIDLSNAYLEYVNFTNTDLSDANLSNAIITHAVFNNTKLTGVNLQNANIGASTIDNSDFVDSDLIGATLSKALIKNTRFHRCTFGERDDLFLETVFEEVDFTGSHLRETYFIEVDLTHSVFDKADLSGSSFIQCCLENSSFNSATLNHVNVIEAKASGCTFDNAQMRNARFVGGNALKDASFSRADLTEANLRDASLDNADFTQAVLNKADFGGASLTKAVLEKAKAFQTQFIGADLSNASCRRLDLMEGSLMKAKLLGTNFKEANLYSVSFLNSTLGDTAFSDAYLEKTILKDWRPM